jgi:hypothetical protein
LRVSSDGNEIQHQNQYILPDGTTKTENFGPYKKPVTRALYLNNGFSWGTLQIEPNSSFWFEIGFRHENKRAGIVVVYEDNKKLSQIIIIPEHLGSFASENSRPTIQLLDRHWQGFSQSMTSNLEVSFPEKILPKNFENLPDDYLIFHFTEGISLCCPPQIESQKDYSFILDWQVNPELVYRGIRNYDLTEFKAFTLQTFTRI